MKIPWSPRLCTVSIGFQSAAKKVTLHLVLDVSVVLFVNAHEHLRSSGDLLVPRRQFDLLDLFWEMETPHIQVTTHERL